MKPSTELFQLIKSLSKSEKRYFKLFSSLQAGEKNYMKLFDAIDQQESYDEPALKIKFSKETFIKHLPSEKNHLYSLILKSLRGFYADKSAAATLQEQLRNIELLFNKALYKECGKIIRKAKRTAYDYEKYYFLLDLINWEKILIEEEYSSGNFDIDLNKLVDEESNCLEKLRNIAEYQILYSKINYVFRKGGFTRNEHEQDLVKEISNLHLIKREKSALSIKAETSRYFIKGLCATTESDSEEAFASFEKVVEIMETNPLIMKEHPKRYAKALNNLLYAFIGNDNWVKCRETIIKLHTLTNKSGFESIDVQVQVFTFSYNAELNFYIYQGDYESAKTAVLPAVLKGLDTYKSKINKEGEMVFYYNISRVYFGCKDYKNALKYNNLVLNNSEAGLREDIYNFARFINLIIHYELKNYDLLDYSVKSINRSVIKNKRNYKFEIIFLNGFKKILKAKNIDDLKQRFINFKEELIEILEDPNEKAIFKYFDFISWLDEKIGTTKN